MLFPGLNILYLRIKNINLRMTEAELLVAEEAS